MPKSLPKKTPIRAKAPTKGTGYARLVTAIEAVNFQMAERASVVVNQVLVIRNWVIGAYLVKFEQRGADRAKYGAKLLEQLAKDLEKRSVKGLNVRQLRNCRLLYMCYPQIRQSVIAEFGTVVPVTPLLLTKESTTEKSGKRIRQSVIAELPPQPISSPLMRKSPSDLPRPLPVDVVLQFSWTKLLELIALDDQWKRAFFENECLKGNWSVRQLQRQIESLLYERTGLSKNKEAVIQRARGQEPQETIADLVRDPYVLEFAGLAERPEYSENDLETAYSTTCNVSCWN